MIWFSRQTPPIWFNRSSIGVSSRIVLSKADPSVKITVRDVGAAIKLTSPEEADEILAELRRHRELSEEEKRDLYSNYLSVARVRRDRACPCDLGSFGAFLRWSLASGYELGKILVEGAPKGWVEHFKPISSSDADERDDVIYDPIWVVPMAPDESNRFRIPTYRWISARSAAKKKRSSLNAAGARTVAARRTTIHREVTAWGETKSLAAWSSDPRASVSDKVIRKRLDAGMSAEEAISAPRLKGGRPPKDPAQ